MSTNNHLFNIDAIVVDGVALAFEGGTGEIEGAGRWENEVVPCATGDDYVKRKRVATTLKAKIQFGKTSTPDAFSGLSEVQISARDIKTGRRCLMPKCTFGSMGAIGQGSVDITFNVLAAPQWL